MMQNARKMEQIKNESLKRLELYMKEVELDPSGISEEYRDKLASLLGLGQEY